MNTTLCWSCNYEYGSAEPACPKCGAHNGNMRVVGRTVAECASLEIAGKVRRALGVSTHEITPGINLPWAVREQSWIVSTQ
jgi:hypothetical protein